MNTKSRKKHKSTDCEKKPNNEGAEVFVLPPNLLEKLGIKLENIVSNGSLLKNEKNPTGSDERSLLSSHHNVSGCLENTKSVNKKNESSILETASLMKESVFLSPTFVPTVANVIPGEVEIASPYNHSQRYDVVAGNQIRKTDCFPAQISPKQNAVSCNNLESVKNNKINLIAKTHVYDGIECENVATGDSSVFSDSVNNINTHYSSRGHTSNFTYEDTMIKPQNAALASTEISLENNNISIYSNCRLEIQQEHNFSTKRKIQVINEEAVDIGILYRLKNSNPNLNNNTLTPVSKDMLLPTFVKKNTDVIGSSEADQNKISDKAVHLLHDVGKVNTINKSNVEKSSERVVNLKHDIDKADTNVRQSEIICDLVVDNTVKHVDVLFFDNGHNMSNTSNIKNIQIVNVADTEHNNDGLGNGLVTAEKLINDNINDVNNKVGSCYNAYLSTGEVKQCLADDISVVMNDTHSEIGCLKTSVDVCELGDIDDIPNIFIDSYELDNLNKIDECSQSRTDDEFLDSCLNSTEHITHIDIEMIVETENSEYNKECSINEQDAWDIINNEGVCLSEQESIDQDSTKDYIFPKILPNGDNKKEINKSENVWRKSKLCIQGVEKPGGDIENELNTENFKARKDEETIKPNLDKTVTEGQKQSMNELPECSHSIESNQVFLPTNALKTYKRIGKKIQQNVPSLNDIVPSACSSNKSNENNDLESSINLELVCNTRDFCLCGDFGQMKYYEYDSSYEHIHFWQHRDVTSDCNLIFSIYDVDTYTDYDNVERIIEVTNESLEDLADKICWNKIYTEINFTYSIEDDEHELKNTKHITTKPEQHILVSPKIHIDPNKVTPECEFSRASNTSTVTDTEPKSMDAGKIAAAVKERSDIVYNTFLQNTESNEINQDDLGDPDSINMRLIQNTNKTYGKRPRMQVSSVSDTNSNISMEEKEPHPKKDTKCGVCGRLLANTDWEEHSSTEHGLIAWKAGETIDFKNNDLIIKVKQKLKKDGVLKCTFCQIEFTKYKRYMLHVKDCMQEKNKAENRNVRKRRSSSIKDPIVNLDSKNTVNCGVCNKNVGSSDWIVHISQKHNYLAWKSEEAPLKLDEPEIIEKYLCNMIKNHGPLICIKCGVDRKYGMKSVKTYLDHIKTCGLQEDTPVQETHTAENNTKTMEENTDGVKTEQDLSAQVDSLSVKCGVCGIDFTELTWIDHIGKEHNYLAWKQGEDALNLDDKEEVWKHLYAITKKYDGLICSKCGIKRKYVKMYLSHLEECDGTTPLNESLLSSTLNESQISKCNTPVTREEKIKCGVCLKRVVSSKWFDHIWKKHNYLAWKDGDPPLKVKRKSVVEDHLFNIMKEYGHLICTKCDSDHTFSGEDSVKTYLSHVDICGNVADSSQQELMSENNPVKCGVCGEEVKSAQWFKHIENNHQYLAWKDGEEPVDLDDIESIRLYLFTLLPEVKVFNCSKCGVQKKYPKSFITHIKTCKTAADDNNVSSTSIDDTFETANNTAENVNARKSSVQSENESVKCGVCGENVKSGEWVKHIEAKHDYLAWKDGETPLALDDTESVRLYLFTLIHQVPAFKCSKCGIQKKYPKSYITHMENCNSVSDDVNNQTNGTCTCAVCSEIVPIKSWKDHAMANHYNIAWKVGDPPIDLKSTYGTDKYLKDYKLKKGKLVCKKCGVSRISAAGFYAHILTCGKTEEELEEYQNVCEVCNNKYICIYKNQHMAFHREQEYAKERKSKVIEVKDEVGCEPPVGRRKAAVKANTVIEKLNINNEFTHTCPTCGFDTESEKKLARHKCVPTSFEGNSGSSESEESDDTLDSRDIDLSAEEEAHDTSRRKRNKESIVQAKVPNVPFKYNEVNSYISQSNEDFYKIHFTNETLYPQWLRGEYEVLLDQSTINNYLPILEQSCRVNLNKEWVTFDRFQAIDSDKVSSMFVGASVQCLSWVPSREDAEDDESNYLAISCHQGSDCPRLNYDELRTHAGLIQIWDLGNFQNKVPSLAMGIAHEYGTVWAMDWCPSGAREVRPGDNKQARLGLLALACSSGLVFILSVPYPSTSAESGVFVKLKAVAVLKLSTKSERKIYQATTVMWSKQKDHSFVVVGYSDGTTAMYDLNGTSPLLQSKEDGVTVFYPYHDEREHNVCITDVDAFEGGACGEGPGRALSSASLGGAAALLRPAAPLARLATHATATGCKFAPGWPSFIIAVDDAIASQSPNELEWYGCARRLGPVRASCGCRRCGRALLYAPPMLRTLRALPPYADIRKQNILGIRAMPLTKKRERRNDELSMLVEPLTYDEVITQFGVEIFLVDSDDKNNSINTVKEQWTERFPLPDVTSMAFCPSERHHQKAAVGLHAGIVLVITV